jgi:glycosyltransferase involved in cell wall biosynthesis
MPAISLCMIVKDEEAWIAKAIQSVKPAVGEIIVVDTGSKDRTPKIARELGAKVFFYGWDGSFSNARNFAISMAKGDWILSLDADEVISGRDLDDMRLLARNRHFDGFSFVIRNYTDNEFISNFVHKGQDSYTEGEGFKGYERTRVVRMFRRDPKIQFEREIHEVVEHSIIRKKGKILEVDVPIHHMGALKPQEGKPERYQEMSWARLKENPDDPKSNFDIGYFHFQKRDFAKAEEHYRKALGIKEDYLEAYFGLQEVYAEQGRYQEALEVNRKILELDPRSHSACYNMGELFMGMGKPLLAKGMYEKALELGSPQKGRIGEVLERIKG